MSLSRLASKIQCVSEHLTSPNLKVEIASAETMLLVIDVQRMFADSQHPAKRGSAQTEEVSARIASIVPEFRKARIPVCAVYWSRDRLEDPAFFNFQPKRDDLLVRKGADSAFRGNNLNVFLQERGIRHLLTCGFNTSACVKRTVLDARHYGYDVTLFEDLVANDLLNSADASGKDAMKEMRKAGVVVLSSQDFLGRVKNAP